MSEIDAKKLYDNLLSDGSLIELGFTGNWQLDRTAFLSEYSMNEDLGLYDDDEEFEEGLL